MESANKTISFKTSLSSVYLIPDHGFIQSDYAGQPFIKGRHLNPLKLEKDTVYKDQRKQTD